MQGVEDYRRELTASRFADSSGATPGYFAATLSP